MLQKGEKINQQQTCTTKKKKTLNKVLWQKENDTIWKCRSTQIAQEIIITYVDIK